MKKNFLKFLLFYVLACISWGKYAWDKMQENESIIFKVIAFILLLVSLYFLVFAIWHFLQRKKGKDSDINRED